MNVYEFLAAYFPPPMLGFLLGVGVGFGGGLVFSKGFFLYLSDGRRLRCERSDQEKAEQRRTAEEAAAKEREARIAELKKSLKYDLDGNLRDSQGNIYCPLCLHERLRLVVVERPFEKTVHCPECNSQRYFGPPMY